MARNYVSEYNRIAKRINEMRKRMLRRRKRQEEQDIAMRMRGIMPPRRPDLVIPNRIRMIERPDANTMTKEAFTKWKEQVQANYGSLSGRELSFYKLNYKQNYLDALRSENFIGIEPKKRTAPNGKEYSNTPYSKEQIENEKDPEKKQLMELHNKIYYMSTEEFMELYDKGYIIALKFIYTGLQDSKHFDFYDEQTELINQAHRERYRSGHLTRKERRKGKKLNKIEVTGVRKNLSSAKGIAKARKAKK